MVRHGNEPQSGGTGRARALVDGGGDGAQRGRVVLGNADQRLAGVHGSRGELGAVEDEMRRGLEQEAVLGAAGLTLGAVGHDDRPAAGLPHRAQLDRGREIGSSAPAQAGALHLVDQLARVGTSSERQGTVLAHVFLMRHATAAADAAQQPWEVARRRGHPTPWDARAPTTSPLTVPARGSIWKLARSCTARPSRPVRLAVSC